MGYVGNIKTLIQEVIDNDNTLTLVQGDPGVDGSDAYEIAVEQGFVGTRSAWVASLKGEPGDIANVDALTAQLLNKADISDVYTTTEMDVLLAGKEAADSTTLKSADIGITVQPHDTRIVIDVDYTHTDNNYTTADRVKLGDIEYGAEVNNITDVYADMLLGGQSNTLHHHASDRDRANHIGTQAVSTVTGLQGTLDALTAATLNHPISGAEAVDLTDSGNSYLHYHDTDRNRSNHTGEQAIDTVTGLQTALNVKVDKVIGKQLSTEDFTTALKALVEVNKVKDVTADVINNKLVITYEDNTTANLDLTTVITDIHVSGATLDAGTNVLTLTSTNGGADVTVDLSDFVNSTELTTALGGRDIGTDGTTLDQLESVVHGVFDLGNENIVTINADPTKYDIAAFDYYIGGVKYSYAGATGLVSGFAGGDNFMIVNVTAAGVVELTKDTFNDATSLDNALELARLATIDGTTIAYAGQSHFDADTFMKDTYRWAKLAKGTNYIGTAGSISESATPRQISIASGDIVSPDIKLATITGTANISAVPYFHTGGVLDFGPTQTPLVVSNSQYDNGTSLVAVGNNKWLSHTLLRSASTGTVYFVYSSAEYGNEAEALDAAPTNLFPVEKATDVSILASVVIQQGGASISKVIDRRNSTSNIVSASTSTLQTTYDRSSTPEIITNAIAGAVTVQGGTGVDTDSNIEVRNNAGTVTAKVQANGTAKYTGMVLGITTKTTDYTIVDTDHTVLIDCTSNDVSVTLPDVTVVGKMVVLKRIDNSANVCTIVGTIDSAVNATIDTQNVALTVQSDGTNWYII